jgi:hypothetical protein
MDIFKVKFKLFLHLENTSAHIIIICFMLLRTGTYSLIFSTDDAVLSILFLHFYFYLLI